jgi:hypothetical protein
MEVDAYGHRSKRRTFHRCKKNQKLMWKNKIPQVEEKSEIKVQES